MSENNPITGISEMATRTVVQTVENAVLYSDGTILVKNVKASYPHVLKPFGGKDKDGNDIPPAFSVIGLAPKKTHNAAKELLVGRIDELLKENKVAELKAELKFLRNGDLEGTSPEEKGHWVISTREQAARPPSVRAADGKTRMTEADDAKIYGGCYVNILLRPWWQNNKFGKRVNAGLTAVQFLRDGEPLGSGRVSDTDIDETFADERTVDSNSGWMSDLESEAEGL